MTLDELMDDWKDNKKIMEEMFKVLALNNSHIFPLFGNKFYMRDPEVSMNNCTYWFTKNKLYGFDYRLGEVFKVNIVIPDNWKKQIVKYYFYKRD